MFENALITRAGIERQVDLGLVAETIFFYRSVQLVLNASSIIALAKRLSPDDLIALLNRSELKLSYSHPTFGVVSAGTPRAHNFGAFTFRGRQERKAPHYKDEIAFRLQEQLGKNLATRRLITTLTDRVTPHRFNESQDKEKIISDLVREDIANREFTRQAALTVLKHLVPAYTPLPDFRFEIYNVGDGYVEDTNVDFTHLNKIYHQAVSPSHSSITPAYLLAHVVDARVDSYFGAHYLAEIVTTPLLSDLIRLKHFDFLKRREINVHQIDLFQDTALQDVPSLREVVNSGGRSITDFLKLLDNAERFRTWLHATNPDVGLVRNYYVRATEKTWADKLPTKSTRFVFATGLGMLADLILPTGLGTAAGVTLGAADSLYLDRLIKGWRPNQFIEGPYHSFVTSETDRPRKIA